MIGEHLSGEAILAELNLDDSCFKMSRDEDSQLYSELAEVCHIILGGCPYLEHLSLKNVTWGFSKPIRC